MLCVLLWLRSLYQPYAFSTFMKSFNTVPLIQLARLRQIPPRLGLAALCCAYNIQNWMMDIVLLDLLPPSITNTLNNARLKLFSRRPNTLVACNLPRPPPKSSICIPIGNWFRFVVYWLLVCVRVVVYDLYFINCQQLFVLAWIFRTSHA